MLFRNRKKYQMDLSQADMTLQNVFAACEQVPNTVPFDKIILRQKLNTRTYDRLLIITGMVLLLTFLSPLAVAPVTTFWTKTCVCPVTLVSHDMDNDVLYLRLNGDDILFDQAYQELADGTIEPALSYDEDSKQIAFTYHDMEANIYIPVENAVPLHLLLSPE